MNRWEKHELLVLHELRRLNENIEELTKKTNEIDKQITVVKVKTSMLASLSATITSIVILITESFIRRL